MISHKKYQFNLKLKKKINFILFKEINNKKINPIPTFIEYSNNKKYGFLFESVEKEVIRGRYTICGYDPQIIIKDKKNKLSIKTKNKNKIIYKKNPLSAISEIIANLKFSNSEALPPMASSFFGYFGYETINYREDISKKVKKDDLDLPDSLLFLPKFIIIHDNKINKIFITSPILANETKENDYVSIINEFEYIEKDLITNKVEQEINFKKRKKIQPKSNIDKVKFINNIKRVKKYIHDGDIFQAVIGQRFEVDYNKSAKSLYQVLRKTNPSPFMFIFNFPNFNIVGSSPEILVRVKNGNVTIRPIAGTRPRGRNKNIDIKNEQDLLSDSKELSEHLMLLDLGRNDVGKVSSKNSVSVTSSFFIERYSHVMHIVSNVEGALKKGLTSFDALMSGFPAGTVSGAPKIRAMEIIDELETYKRGVYGGGIGYFSSTNEMDTCIALRTSIIKNNKLYVQAGGGIVYDSNPQMEFVESVNKAKAIFNAAEISLGNYLL